MVKMKRIVYIIAVMMTVLALVGGSAVSADYQGENATRVASYEENGTGDTLAGSENDPADAPTDAKTSREVESTPTDSTNTAEEDAEKADGATANGSTENADDTANGSTENADGAAKDNGDENAEATANDGGTSNPFEAFFNTVKEYATEIFCALTFVGSLILAYAYKCGLIPIIKGGIGALSATVSHIKETAERSEEKTGEIGKTVADRLGSAETALGDISEMLSLMATKLDRLEADGDERRKMRIVMNAEVDMLYSIFMTSALPQYQKDEVGARIAKMREVIGDDED